MSTLKRPMVQYKLSIAFPRISFEYYYNNFIQDLIYN